MALVRKFNLKWNHVFLVLSVFGVCSNHSVSIFCCWDDHYIEESVETQKKSPKKQQNSHFFFKFNQIVVKVINERFCFSSFTKTLQAEVRYFKLGPQNLPQDGSLLNHARLWTSYYWPTVSQTLLISCKLVSLEEKHQWYFITVNPKCPGLRIKNSSSDGQRMIYVNGGYI